MIAIIEGSEKKFGIAIERFKNIPFTFAMEDVPGELADRMLSKFTEKKDGETICDWSCRGPTLLLRAAAWNPTEKLYARVKEGDLRTKFIVKKELGSKVNIVYGEEMHFDKIIMNPPYDWSLHLKILNEAIKYGTEVVNLSPIRWLQDPLAEYKQGSDWKKFENIRNRIVTVDEIKMVDATTLFDAAFSMNIGILYINEKGGWKRHENTIINKVVNKINIAISDVMSINESDGWRVRIKKLMPIPSNRPKGTAVEYTRLYLCHQSLSWVYKDGYQNSIHWSENKLTGAGGPKLYTKKDKIPYSIKFSTENEAKNF